MAGRESGNEAQHRDSATRRQCDGEQQEGGGPRLPRQAAQYAADVEDQSYEQVLSVSSRRPSSLTRLPHRGLTCRSRPLSEAKLAVRQGFEPWVQV
jgi:hypothetical protein